MAASRARRFRIPSQQYDDAHQNGTQPRPQPCVVPPPQPQQSLRERVADDTGAAKLEEPESGMAAEIYVKPEGRAAALSQTPRRASAASDHHAGLPQTGNEVAILLQQSSPQFRSSGSVAFIWIPKRGFSSRMA